MFTASSPQEQLVLESLGSSGDPVVLLHGWGQSRADLRPLGQLLAKVARVYLVDLPGFGESPVPDVPWSTADYAKYLANHLKARNIISPILLGHSFGGRVAVQFASLFPDDVRGIVLLASAGLPSKKTLLQALRLKAIRFSGIFLKWVQRSTKLPVHDWFIEKFGSRDYKSAGPLRAILVKAVNEDLSSAAKEVHCPALLLWGENDRETPPDIGMRYQQLIKNSKLMVLPGKDHFLHRGVGAHLCAYHILQWLSSLR